MKYKGIDKKDLWLLAENRFNDSKIFYDENKDRIKQNILLPMQAIMEDLTPFMQNIDKNFFLVPSKRISRIRRDTRFTKDKTLYRENVWMMFEPLSTIPGESGFVLEITPDNILVGTGMYPCAPRLMAVYREEVQKKLKLFGKEVNRLSQLGYLFEGTSYAKPKQVFEDELLTKLYNRKDMYIVKRECNLELLNKPEEFIDWLKQEYTSLTPIYNFFSRCCKEYKVYEENLII